jgi:glycosyltransferase involved in cell wall biosynthesis
MIKIVHIATNLGGGGVTWMLYNLIKHLNKDQGFEHVVICLRSNDIQEQLNNLGVRTYSLSIKDSIPSINSVFLIRKLLEQEEPCLIQGWMYHGNIAAFFSNKSSTVLWGIHHTINNLNKEKFLTRLLILASSRLSNNVEKIIYCSEVSLKQHESLGFSKSKSVYIPNGFPVEHFQFKIESRKRIRQEFGVFDDCFLIGQAARFHPMKNHLGMIRCFSKVAQKISNAILVMIGHGINSENNALSSTIEQYGLGDRVILLEHRADMPDIYSALDAYVSPSIWGEAFPLVLGEAMCCELPCVVTDIGDSSIIVGEAGYIIENFDDNSFANALIELARMNTSERRILGKLARQQIVEHFSISKIAKQYKSVYLNDLSAGL